MTVSPHSIALHPEESLYRLLVEAVTDYAIYLLDPTGNIVSWNPGAQRFKGYVANEIIGQHFSRFYTEDDRQTDLPARALATAAREGKFEGEGWRMRKDGSRFWAHVVIDPVRDASGHVIGYAKVTRDLSERRAAEETLRTSREQLEDARESLFQARKLDAIGQLTGGVAHDFNNLLMVILSSLQLARRRVGDEDTKLNGLLDNAAQAARRGASLTQRMLSFARRQALNPVSVNVVAAVNGMADLLRRSLGPTIVIRLPQTAGLPLVQADVNQLELALLNLAVNARDAMPQGGTIAIDAVEQRVAEPEATTKQRVRSGHYVVLQVIDEGEGMDEATLTRATEPFFTTKGVGKGTGLGLSMVEGLASQSGGQLVLRSHVGVGTTAELWLPVSTQTQVDASPDSAPVPLQAHGALLSVLVVDDDNLVLSNTISMLDELGHTVASAGSAEQALSVLRRDPQVQILITDHAMPGTTGVELIARAKAEFPQLISILATGYAELDVHVPDGVLRLPKPFSLEELVLAMAAALKR